MPNYPRTKTSKVCTKCGKRKYSGSFYSCHTVISGLAAECKKCKSKNSSRPEYMQAWRNSHKEYRRDYALKVTYGVSLDEYKEMLAKQNGICAICGAAPEDKRNGHRKNLCVDHDHITKQRRKLLCVTCNTWIGLLENNPEIFEKAKQYLLNNGELCQKN